MKTRSEASKELMSATKNNDMKGVLAALNAGADVNEIPEGWRGTALYTAAAAGNTALAKLLIERGADVNRGMIKTKTGDLQNATPLNIASEYGHTDVVELLLAHQADTNLLRNDGVSPLILAAQKGRIPVVKLLVKHGADIQCTSKIANNPLLAAARNGHGECVDFLVDELLSKHRESRADLLKFLQTNDCLKKCLTHATDKVTFSSLLKLIHFLYQHDFSYDDLHPLLPKPSEFTHKDFIKTTYEFLKSLPILSRYNALRHIGGPGYHVFTDLCHNQRNGYYDSDKFHALYLETDIELRKLKELKDKTELKKKLYYAAEAGDVETAEICITNGAPVNEAVSSMWDLPIYVAVINGRAAMVDFLIKNGADKNHYRESYLTDHSKRIDEVAIINGDVEVLKVLASHGVIGCGRDCSNSSAFLALRCRKIEAAKYLFENSNYRPAKMPRDDHFTILVQATYHHPDFLSFMIDQICAWPIDKVKQFLIDADFKFCVSQSLFKSYNHAFLPLMRVIDFLYNSGVDDSFITQFMSTESLFGLGKKYKQDLLDKAAELPLEERRELLQNILDPKHFYGQLARKSHGFRNTDESHEGSMLFKANVMLRDALDKLAANRQPAAPAAAALSTANCELQKPVSTMYAEATAIKDSTSVVTVEPTPPKIEPVLELQPVTERESVREIKPVAVPPPVAAIQPKKYVNPFFTAAEIAFSSDDIPDGLPAPMEPVKENPFEKAASAKKVELLAEVDRFFAAARNARPQFQAPANTQTKTAELG